MQQQELAALCEQMVAADYAAAAREALGAEAEAAARARRCGRASTAVCGGDA